MHHMWDDAIRDHPPLRREIAAGIVEPGTDGATCIHCGRQALLYALDVLAQQWFTCLDHHGLIVVKLIRGDYDRQCPPLPPL